MFTISLSITAHFHLLTHIIKLIIKIVRCLSLTELAGLHTKLMTSSTASLLSQLGQPQSVNVDYVHNDNGTWN